MMIFKSTQNASKLALAGVIGILSLASCGKEVAEDTGPVIRPAKLIEVKASSNVEKFNFPAIIEASTSTDITFQVGGLIQEFSVAEGQEIAEGTVIAKLDQRDYRNQVATAKAQYDSAQTEFKRAERLLAQDAIAASAVDQRRTQRDVARAALDSASKALEDTVLKSPFAGVVATKHAKAFQNIAPQAKIITLQTVGAAEAAVQIPSSLVARSGRIEPLETVIVLDAVPDIAVPAVFKSAQSQADSTTQTFGVQFSFTPPEGVQILPGMTGTIKSTLRIAGVNGDTEQITIPTAAIVTDGDGTFVWVVDKTSMTVSKRLVKSSGIGASLTVIEGLEAGETIVGAGAAFLHDGAQITEYQQ